MADDGPKPSPYRALIGLLLFAAAIAAVLFVMYRLHQAGRMQDCLASGRTNCAPIEVPGR
jgi:hypothetical protein